MSSTVTKCWAGCASWGRYGFCGGWLQQTCMSSSEARGQQSSQTEGKAHTRYCASVQEDQATDKDIKASDNTTHVPSVERTRFELDLIKIKTELATTTTATSMPHSAGCWCSRSTALQQALCRRGRRRKQRERVCKLEQVTGIRNKDVQTSCKLHRGPADKQKFLTREGTAVRISVKNKSITNAFTFFHVSLLKQMLSQGEVDSVRNAIKMIYISKTLLGLHCKYFHHDDFE